MSSGAESSRAGGTPEVPRLTATASGKKLTISSPLAGERVVSSLAEQASERSGEFSSSLKSLLLPFIHVEPVMLEILLCAAQFNILDIYRLP